MGKTTRGAILLVSPGALFFSPPKSSCRCHRATVTMLRGGELLGAEGSGRADAALYLERREAPGASWGPLNCPVTCPVAGPQVMCRQNVNSASLVSNCPL